MRNSPKRIPGGWPSDHHYLNLHSPTAPRMSPSDRSSPLIGGLEMTTKTSQPKFNRTSSVIYGFMEAGNHMVQEDLHHRSESFETHTRIHSNTMCIWEYNGISTRKLTKTSLPVARLSAFLATPAGWLGKYILGISHKIHLKHQKTSLMCFAACGYSMLEHNRYELMVFHMLLLMVIACYTML